MAAKIKNTTTLTRTTLAPVGAAKRYDMVRPTKKQKTEINAEVRITERNLRHTRMEVNAGKMIKAEINKAPIIRIPKTMVIAVSNAISIL